MQEKRATPGPSNDDPSAQPPGRVPATDTVVVFVPLTYHRVTETDWCAAARNSTTRATCRNAERTRSVHGRAPRAAGQSGHRPPDCQIEALDEGGLDQAGQTERAQSLAKLVGCAKIDMLPDFGHASAAIPFDDLGIQPLRLDGPDAPALTDGVGPLAQMGRERLEIERHPKRCQDFGHVVAFELPQLRLGNLATVQVHGLAKVLISRVRVNRHRSSSFNQRVCIGPGKNGP